MVDDSMDVDTSSSVSGGDDDLAVVGQSRRNNPGPPTAEGRPAAESKEGWVIMVSGINPEVSEAEVMDVFEEYGRVTAIRLNQSLATGYLMGYALLQYDTQEQAADAIAEQNGAEFFDNTLSVDWAFIEPPSRDEEDRLVERVRGDKIVNTRYSRYH